MNKIEYTNTPIKRLGRVITGKTPSTQCREYYGDGYMFITPVELHNGYNIQVSEKHITDLGLESIKTNSITGTSVLVGCIGWDMGNVAMCHEKCATNQQINSITDFKPEYNPYYIYYWLQGKKDYLFSIASVTRTPILSKSSFEEVIIPIPSRPIQDDIVSVLKSIDNKIEINKGICSELEAMAKTLYDYWFVQFDFPDEKGKPYRTSGGEMVWNGQLKRKIPKGWNVIPIGNILELLKDGTHNPPKRHSSGIPLLTGIMFGNIVLGYNGVTYITKKDYDMIHTNYAPQKNDFIMTKIGSVGNVNILRTADIPLAIHCNSALIRFKRHIPIPYAYFMLKSNIFQAYLKKEVSKTVQEFVSLERLASIQLCLPSGKIFNQFAEITEHLFEKMVSCETENSELSKLRDWLLPMLMNGQARVE